MAGGERGGNVARNMKSMQPPLVVIFFMTYFYKARGTMAPLDPLPLDPLPKCLKYYMEISSKYDQKTHVDNDNKFARSHTMLC